METLAYREELERLKALREEFEAGRTSQDEMNPEDVILLNLIYKLEILDLEYSIDKEREILEDYKQRMRNAIDFLKSKKNT